MGLIMFDMEQVKIIIPFSLDIADKIFNGYTNKAKFVTRDGRHVRIICMDWKSESGSYSVIGLLECKSKFLYEKIITYTIDGNFTSFGGEHKNDLMIEIDRDFYQQIRNTVNFNWYPKENEVYYYIDDNMQVHSKIFQECEFLSQTHIKTNNIFFDKESADIVVEKTKQLYNNSIKF